MVRAEVTEASKCWTERWLSHCNRVAQLVKLYGCALGFFCSGMQAFTWDINDSMYSDELTGEAADPLAPVPKAPVMRSSSEMSDQMQRLSNNEGRRASAMSAQVSLPDDPGSNRASLMGSGGG